VRDVSKMLRLHPLVYFQIGINQEAWSRQIGCQLRCALPPSVAQVAGTCEGWEGALPT
jgi:hypothetical protein